MGIIDALILDIRNVVGAFEKVVFCFIEESKMGHSSLVGWPKLAS